MNEVESCIQNSDVVDTHFNGNGASAAAWIKQFALRETKRFLQAPVLCDHNLFKGWRRGYRKVKTLFGLKNVATKFHVDTDKENAAGAKNASASRCQRQRSASGATASVTKHAPAQVGSRKSAAVAAHETQLGGQRARSCTNQGSYRASRKSISRDSKSTS